MGTPDPRRCTSTCLAVLPGSWVASLQPPVALTLSEPNALERDGRPERTLEGRCCFSFILTCYQLISSRPLWSCRYPTHRPQELCPCSHHPLPWHRPQHCPTWTWWLVRSPPCFNRAPSLEDGHHVSLFLGLRKRQCGDRSCRWVEKKTWRWLPSEAP